MLQIVLSNMYLCAGAKFSFLKTAKHTERKIKCEIYEFQQQELRLIIAYFSCWTYSSVKKLKFKRNIKLHVLLLVPAEKTDYTLQSNDALGNGC